MANSRKKISELPALSVASLDTTFVLGISGSTTYKISINNLTSSLDTTFATDLVTNALSSSLNSKLSTSSFNSYTSSFTASVASGTISGSSQLTSSFDTRYVVSGSITQTTWDNIANKPSGIVSQSTDLSSLNTFTASISTASLVNRLNAIESVSGSWITESETGSFLTSLSGAISSSTQILDLGFVTGSYTTINSFNSLTQSFNSISQSFNVISGSVGTVDFNGVVSGSSQLTSSYDTRYVISGSVGATPLGTISSSAQITAFGFISSSTTIDTGSLVTTSSFNSYTASLNAFSSSLSVTANSSTKILDAYYTSAAAWSGSYSGNGGTVKVEANFALYSTSIGTKTFTLFRNGVAVDSGSFYFNNTGVHATMPTLYYIGTNETGTNTYSVGHNAVSDGGDSCNIVVTETFNTLNAGLISGSAQITTFGFVSGSYETTGRGIISSSANLVTTSSYNADSASFDSRINSIVTESGSNLTYFIEAYANETYTLPGGFVNDPCRYSVVSATENVPSNWFNTSTYRFTPQKAGYWEIIASYDVYRNTEASMAIRKNGGIVASAGSFNAVAQDISKIIYLNGSTDYIDIVNTGGAALQRDQYQQRSWFQAKFVGNIDGSTDLLSANNTFTGTNVFSGSTTLRGAVNIGTGSGFEGGEILLAYAQGGSTSLTGSSLVVDVYADKLRIFESGGNSRGAYLDLTKQAAGVGSEILTKASGFVNRGVDVTLGNLKARIAATGNVALQLSTVSGTYSVYGSSVYSLSGVAGTTIDGSAPKAISTTPAYLNSGYNFGTAGSTDTWNIMDTSNSIAWRITMILGAGVNNNLVSIERLH